MADEPQEPEIRELLDVAGVLAHPVTLNQLADYIDSDDNHRFSREEMLALTQELIDGTSIDGTRVRELVDRQLDTIRQGTAYTDLEARYNAAAPGSPERAQLLQELAAIYVPYAQLQAILDIGVQQFELTGIGMQSFGQLSAEELKGVFPSSQNAEEIHQALQELKRYDFTDIPKVQVEDLLGSPLPFPRLDDPERTPPH